MLGAFRRGAIWAVGIPVLGYIALFLTPTRFVVLLFLLGIAVRVAAAVDAFRVAGAKRSWMVVLIVVAAVVLSEFVIREPLAHHYRDRYAQTFTIPSASMQSALLVGDYIVVDKSAYRSTDPRRGDIVVFTYPLDERRTFIQRVIGLPGESLVIRGGDVHVNGKPLEEPWLAGAPAHRRDGSCNHAYGCEPVEIPRNAYFVMGDYRDNAMDSRYWGFVTRDKIKGRADWIYWSWDSERHRPRFGRLWRSL